MWICRCGSLRGLTNVAGYNGLCVCIYIYVCICIHMYICIPQYIHIYMYTIAYSPPAPGPRDVGMSGCLVV